ALGRWIFDCGHPGGTAGHCSATSGVQCVIDADCRPPTCAQCAPAETCAGAHFGYTSELHPPQAAVAIRSGRGALLAGPNPVPVTKADIFVSPFGGGAGDRCILTHQTPPLDLLNRVECFPLSQPVAPINSTDFVFDLPLPEQPPGGHALWNIINAPALANLPGVLDRPATVAVSGPTGADHHIEVRVRMTQRDANGHFPTGYAGSIVAGWDNGTGNFTHLGVTVQSVVIRNALQPVHPDVPRTCIPGGNLCVADTDCPEGETCSGPVKSWRL